VTRQSGDNVFERRSSTGITEMDRTTYALGVICTGNGVKRSDCFGHIFTLNVVSQGF